MSSCKFTSTLLAVVYLCGASLANAVPVAWQLDGVVFDDGATASGSFTYDADTNTLVEWDIDVAGGSLADCTYSDATALAADPPSATQVNFASPCFDDNRLLTLDLAQPLTNAGGTSFIQLSSVESFFGGGAPRNVSEGSVSGLPPPPPAPRTDEHDTGFRVPAVNLYADPVVLTTGANRFGAKMLDGPGHLMAFEFVISYTSTESGVGPLGRKWTHNFNWRVDEFSGGVVRVKHGDGAADYYDAVGGGVFTPQLPGVPETLVQNVDGTYTWISTVDEQYSFTPDGKLSSIVDSNDNTFTLAYDFMGRLATITDATSAVTTFSYDGSNRITTVDYAGLESATFTYSGDDLASYIEPGPITTEFSYDVDGNLLSASLDGTALITNVYDSSGRVVSQTNANGTTKTISYSTGGGGEAIASITDGESNSQTREYGDNSAMSSWTDVLGGTWTVTHDTEGNELTVTNPLGHTTTKTYDADGNLLSDTDALGSTISFAYDAEGNITSSTDPLGHVTGFTYDVNGNLASITDQNGDTTSFTYTSTGIKGMVASTTDRHGHTTAQTWTPSGELQSLTDASGATVGFSYDGLGRPTAVADPDGNSFGFGYDAAGNQTSVTDPLGNTTSRTYNAMGALTSETEANGATTAMTYTPAGDIETVTDPLGNVHAYVYDDERRVTRRTDPLGVMTEFDWNAADQVTQTTDALGGTVSAAYDAVGNLLTVADPKGNVTSFSYNAANQRLTDVDPLGNVLQNAFDVRGQLSSTTNRRGQLVSYQYDPAGRRTVTTLSDGSTITHNWAAGSNLISLVGPGGTTSHTYDADEKMTSRTDEFGNTIQYLYDGRGNVTDVIYTDGKVVEYSYDQLSRMTQVRDWAGRTTTYTYNNVGVLTSTQLPDGSTVQHVADPSRLTASLTDAAPDGTTIFRSEHTRDASGNTVSEKVQLPLWPTPGMAAGVRNFTHNAANQLTGEDGAPFTNDADGNLTGGPVAGAPMAMSYNDRSQLISAGSDSYRYDSTGMRIRSVVSGTVRRYVWDTNREHYARILEEHDGSGNIVARYVHGLGLISRENAGGQLSVYHYDTRGSTVALTDNAGTITDRYAYDPYGRVVQRVGTTPNPFTYNGRDGVIDDGNGLYFTRIRVYAPGLMRFVHADAVARGHLMSTQSLNRYLYAGGNPVELIDPRGDVPAAAVAFGVGATVGVAGQIGTNLASGNRDFSFNEGGIFHNTPGAALGGGVTAALDVYAIAAGPLGLAGSGAFGAAVGNGTNQLLNIYVFGNQKKFDPIDFGVQVGTAAVLGGVVGAIGKYADEADSGGKVFQYFGNVAETTWEINQQSILTSTRTVIKSSRATSIVSSVLVKGSVAAVKHHRSRIVKTVSPPANTAWRWSKNTGRKVGGFFSSNAKGRAKRNKAGRSITRTGRKIGKKIKGWF